MSKARISKAKKQNEIPHHEGSDQVNPDNKDDSKKYLKTD